MNHAPRIHDPLNPENLLWTTSALLKGVPGLCHGFSLRSAGDFAEPAVQRDLLRRTGMAALRLLTQVHGVGVISAADASQAPKGDAWAGCPKPGALLGIMTADCLPVVLCHPASGSLGLAHAGWRGATAGISVRTLKAMGVPTEEVLVALGPCIRACCYEVGEDVVLAAGRGSPHIEATGNGKYRFDLQGFVRSELLAEGVAPRNVEAIPLCTGCRTDLFFSFRKEGPTGRLCSFLGWEGDERGA